MASETNELEAGQQAASQQTNQIPQNVRNMHNKALAAIERDSFDIAIELLFKCIEKSPNFAVARKTLRQTEIAKYRLSSSKAPHKLNTVFGIGGMLKVKSLISAKKGAEALIAAEKLMQADPLNIDFGRVYADAAAAADNIDAAVMTLELMKENSPASLKLEELLGRTYYKAKRYKEARECLEKVSLMRPSTELGQLLKTIDAEATLNSGWEQAQEEGKDYHAVLANKEQAEQLERMNKAVKTEADADSLIAEAREKIASEPSNLNYYNNLGSLLFQQKRFDEAIQVYNDARKVNAADPEIDRRLNNAVVAKYDADIAAFRAAGDEASAQAKESERDNYAFEEISERVKRYPNDLALRFEYAMQLFSRDMVDEAIPQFQLAQKSPKDRVAALYNMAVCFRRKGLDDMAVMQLEQAMECLPSMTPEKMDVVYELAEIYQKTGKLEQAKKLYQDIYRNDVTYKDIAKKIEQIYGSQKGEA